MTTAEVESQESKIDNVLKLTIDVSNKVNGGFSASYIEKLPDSTRSRFERHGIDLSKGYPEKPPSERIPLYLDDATKVSEQEGNYIIRGKNADPEKKALFSKAKEVRHLTKYVGTELIGVQLADLNEKELDELALLIAERVVVFFRDQDLSPQRQHEIGEFFGVPENHAQAYHVPGLPTVRVIWSDIAKRDGSKRSFKNHKVGTGIWHSDLPFLKYPAGITHLHNDAFPEVGGDTLWTSGYAAYDKLSPALQKFLDGKTALQKSMHSYLDRNDPLSGPKPVLREQPLIRTHPVTGWKSLFVNRYFTTHIVGLEPEESKTILEYLFDVYEKNLDIQVRFNWIPSEKGLGTSALWDNRVSQHNAIYDYEGESRHGTRVVSLAEEPYFDPNSKSQRESLAL